MSAPATPVLDLSRAGADPRALLDCPAVHIAAAGADPGVIDAALRVFRDGGRLESLRLSGDHPQLSPVVSELSGLQHLEIADPELAGLPREIGRLERLRSLRLWTFQLGSLPRSIGALKHLRELTIDAHQLRRLPPQLAELEQLRRIELYFRGHFVPKDWGEIPYFPARFEQTLPELLRLLSLLPRLSALTLGEPPRGWWRPDPILREIPPEIGLLESLETLTLDGCQVSVRLPLQAPGLSRLRSLVAIDTWFEHSDAEIRAALPDTRVAIREDLPLIRRCFGELLDRRAPASELLEGARRLLEEASSDPALATRIALGVGWLLFEDGQHRAAIQVAKDCKRAASEPRHAVVARLLWADATLRADPNSLDAALAALDEIASVPLDGIHDVLIAWHWLVCAAAFRRLNQPDAEREALEHARRHLQKEDSGSPPLLRRLRRWLAPDWTVRA